MMPSRRPLSRLQHRALAALLFGASAAAAPPPAPDPAATAPVDFTALVSLFRSIDAAPDTRMLAASALLASDRPMARATLHEALITDQPHGARQVVAMAIARSDRPPAELIPALAAALDPAQPTLESHILAALSRFRTREAIRPLIARYMAEGATAGAGSLARAASALESQTGLAFGPDAKAWRDWWSEVQPLAESQFALRLGHTLARQSVSIRAERDELAARLLETTRRLYAMTPDERRGELIADLLRSDIGGLRRLGLEFTERSLLNAQPLADTAAASIASLLSDEDAGLRAQAAGLLHKLDRATLVPVIVEALRAEEDPAVAVGLMNALASRPAAGSLDRLIEWLGRDSPARPAAARALEAAARQGLAADPAVSESLKSTLLSVPESGVTPEVVALRARVNGARSVEGYLRAGDSALATAAAAALADDPGNLPLLVESAKGNAMLFGVVSRAILRHQPTTEGLAAARSLPVPDTRTAEAFFAEFTRALPAGALLAAAEKESDPLRRLGLLSPAASQGYFAVPEESAARLSIAGLLARTYEDLQRPLDMLAVLDLVPPGPEGHAFPSLRLTALIWLGRLEQALGEHQVASVPVTAWLDGLSRCLNQPHATDVIRVMETRFEGRLSSDESARLEALKAQFSKAQ